MKKYLLLLSFVIVAISSCKKDSFDATKQAATDDAAIQAYLKANSITAIKDPSGVYYEVVTPGTGAYPTATSTVSVNYSGKLLDGSFFAPSGSTIAATSLTSLIKGWQYGIPHINVGGRIVLFIPSGLGYGDSSPGAGIPANSVLIFTIDLLSFSN